MNAFNKLKAQAEENPTLVIGVLAGAAAATANLINAVSQVQSRRAYARRMNYTVKNKKK